MTQKERGIKDVLCKAISKRNVIYFYYESEISGKKGWRTVEPYIVGIKPNDNIFLAALPVSELTLMKKDRRLRHYSLHIMKASKLEVLPDSYKEPNVPRHMIDDTPTIKVICRYMYNDE